MTPIVSLICPSRGRPADFADFVGSALDRAARAEAVEILCYLDSDDPARPDYGRDLSPAAAARVRFIVGTPLRPVAASNRLAEEARGGLLATATDDLVVETQGWEAALGARAAGFGDGIYCLYWDDGGRAGAAVCTFPVLGRAAYETLRYMLFPGFVHFSADLWHHELFSRLGRLVHVPEVTIRHRHVDQGQAAADRTHERARSLEAFDGRNFVAWTRYLLLDETLLRGAMRAQPG